MFWLGMIVGGIITFSVIMAYACLSAASDSDDSMEELWYTDDILIDESKDFME